MNTTKPYVNLISLPFKVNEKGEIENCLYELHWCHDSMAAAINYYGFVTGEKLSLEKLVDKRAEINGMTALLFGALKVSQGVTVAEFQALLKIITVDDIRAPVLVGVANYWLEPEPEADITDFDLQWPEIKTKRESNEFYYPAFQAELLEAGMNLTEIGKLTMRGMEMILKITRGVREDLGERWLYGEDQPD